MISPRIGVKNFPMTQSKMTQDEFVDIFGHAYEHSPWAARNAWHEQLENPADIISAMRRSVENADGGQIDKLICAHPDLAGKLALSGTLTQSSTCEQMGAGLDQCSVDELAKFEQYNAAYKAKFGFPFIVAVKGLSRADILAQFEKRLKSTLAAERKTALENIHKIARLRIESWFDDKA